MAADFDPGRLNERITLLQPVHTPDSHGQADIQWQAVATVWAEVVPLRSLERFAAAQVQQEDTMKFRIRVRSSIDTSWRLEWKGVGHDIMSVIPLGLTHIELQAIARVKDGR